MIKDYIKNNILLSDGAFGTYYAEIKGNSTNRAELANINDQDTVLKIHKSYISNGSKLIRTNTFSANTKSLGISRDTLKEIITNSCMLAIKAKEDNDIFIAGNIGPISEISEDGLQFDKSELLDEYKFIIDCFMSSGISIFNFETFSSIEYLIEIVKYIKIKIQDSFIAIQFAVTKSGYSRKGIHLEQLLKESELLDIDIIGLNCASGPTHLMNNIKSIKSDRLNLSIYPNAGYPEVMNQRTYYNNNPLHFAEVLKDAKSYGVKIIGGCCGTNPEHILELNKYLFSSLIKKDITNNYKKIEVVSPIHIKNKRELIIAVELDPPFKPDLTKLLSGAKEMKDCGVHIITVADSPSGRMRLNPITVASRIKRDIHIDVMPHICCRDRNLIALKSDILAAHTEGIRNLLLVTGDPIPKEESDSVKKVFNCNSVTLMKQVSFFNDNLVPDSPFIIGGALNLNSVNIESQLEKMEKKIEAGATMFLTQPIYDNRAIQVLENIKKRKKLTILAGILPLVSYKNAQFLNNEFPGITIPSQILSRFSNDMDRTDSENVGINISVEFVNKLKGFVDGFYFMVPFNRTNIIKDIINLSGL